MLHPKNNENKNLANSLQFNGFNSKELNEIQIKEAMFINVKIANFLKIFFIVLCLLLNIKVICFHHCHL